MDEQRELHALTNSTTDVVAGPGRPSDSGVRADAAQRWLTARLSEAPSLKPDQLRRLRQLIGVDDATMGVRSA